MSKKKESIEVLSTEEIHNKLEACINCEHELECTDMLPFPDNLCDRCIKYKKRSINL